MQGSRLATQLFTSEFRMYVKVRLDTVLFLLTLGIYKLQLHAPNGTWETSHRATEALLKVTMSCSGSAPGSNVDCMKA